MDYFHGWEPQMPNFCGPAVGEKKMLWDQNLCLHSFFSFYVSSGSFWELMENWKKEFPFRNKFACIIKVFFLSLVQQNSFCFSSLCVFWLTYLLSTYVPLQTPNAGGIRHTKLVLFKHQCQSVPWVKFCLQKCATSAVSCQYDNSFTVPAVFTKIQRMKAEKYKTKMVSRYFWFLNVSHNFAKIVCIFSKQKQLKKWENKKKKLLKNTAVSSVSCWFWNHLHCMKTFKWACSGYHTEI